MDLLQEQLKTDTELNRVLELSARQSSAAVKQLNLKGDGKTISDRVKIAQYNAVLADIAKVQSDTWESGVGPIIERSYPRAQNAATKSFRDVEELLRDTVEPSKSDALIESFRQTFRSGLDLDRVRRARELSPRVYKNSSLASGAVQRQIRAGIIQGLNARELAQKVRKFISARTPGGVSYAAKRLARTELNNAFHEAQKIEAQAPWVKGVEWKLSGSHPSRPDRCDILATQDLHGMGKGIYPADEIPDKPHPQCLCTTLMQTISESEMLDLLPGLLGQQIA